MWRRATLPLRLLAAARRAHGALFFPALDFLLPANCFACGAPLGRWQHLGACARCWSTKAKNRGSSLAGRGSSQARYSSKLPKGPLNR